MNSKMSNLSHQRRPFHPTSAIANRVEFDDERMLVVLEDGREISVPLQWFPRLLHASPAQRNAVRISRSGQGLHWDQLNEDLSVAGLLAGG